MVTQKMEKEREESQRRVAAKDKLLSKRALHINSLQGINDSYFPKDKIPKYILIDASSSVTVPSNAVIYASLKAQLKEMAYNPRKSRQTVPIQYAWPAEEQDVMPSEDETPFTQLRAGESLLEIHLKVKERSNILFLLSLFKS